VCLPVTPLNCTAPARSSAVTPGAAASLRHTTRLSIVIVRERPSSGTIDLLVRCVRDRA
jgi:hypothetical protein